MGDYYWWNYQWYWVFTTDNTSSTDMLAYTGSTTDGLHEGHDSRHSTK